MQPRVMIVSGSFIFDCKEALALKNEGLKSAFSREYEYFLRYNVNYFHQFFGIVGISFLQTN